MAAGMGGPARSHMALERAAGLMATAVALSAGAAMTGGEEVVVDAVVAATSNEPFRRRGTGCGRRPRA